MDKLTKLVVAALIASLACVLSIIIPNPAWFDFSPALLLVVLFALATDVKTASLCGLLWGLLMIFLGKAYVLSASQVILEYPVACASVAVAGLWRAQVSQKPLVTTMTAFFVAAFVKYTIHFIAGVIFWAKYVQWGLSIWWYSAIVNYGSWLLNCVFASICLVLLRRQILPLVVRTQLKNGCKK